MLPHFRLENQAGRQFYWMFIRMPDKAQEAIKEELTEDIGDPALAQHLYALVGFMRVRSDGGWKQFYSMVQKAFPKKGESLTLDFGEIEA